MINHSSVFKKGISNPATKPQTDKLAGIPAGIYVDADLHNAIVFKDGDEEYALTPKIMKRLIQLVQKEFPEDSL